MPLDDLIGEDISQYDLAARRLLRLAVAVLVTIALASVYAAYTANRANQAASSLEAERMAREAAARAALEEKLAQRAKDEQALAAAARSRDLASKAVGILGRDRDLATLLAMEALRDQPDGGGRGRLETRARHIRAPGRAERTNRRCHSRHRVQRRRAPFADRAVQFVALDLDAGDAVRSADRHPARGHRLFARRLGERGIQPRRHPGADGAFTWAGQLRAF